MSLIKTLTKFTNSFTDENIAGLLVSSDNNIRKEVLKNINHACLSHVLKLIDDRDLSNVFTSCDIESLAQFIECLHTDNCISRLVNVKVLLDESSRIRFNEVYARVVSGKDSSK
jgi:Mg/Co/Ni transporter MgtE